MTQAAASVQSSPALNESIPARVRYFLPVPIVIVLLSLWFFLTNPYYYSDAAWYAGIVRDREHQVIESGHMGWRPLASFLVFAMHSTGLSIDPLQMFRAISSVGTALLVVTTFILARRLIADPLVAWVSTAIVAFSNVCVCYGGSGSAYTPAVALTNVALLCLVRSESKIPSTNDGSVPRALVAVLAFIGAYLCWSLAILTLPLLWIVATQQTMGTLVRRIGRGSAVIASMVLGAVVMAFCIYSLDPARGELTWWAWLRSSSHGIHINVTFINFLRAVIGFINAFVHTGDLGRSLKGIVLGDSSLQDFESHAAQSVFAILFFCFAIIAAIGFWKFRSNDRSKRLFLYTMASLAPVALFAIIWQGSDIERFCLALPLLSISLATGLSAWSWLRGPLSVSIVGLLLISNLVWFACPILASHGGLSMELGAHANRELGDNGVLIITGQELDGPIVGNSFYHHRIVVINVSSVARIHGEKEWPSYLSSRIAIAKEKGGKVAILSDLVGERTPGGIGLSPREMSHPTFEETSSYFDRWPTRHEWHVDRFRFFTLTDSQ